jgi:peptide/nickel transport system substrate-binding protein
MKGRTLVALALCAALGPVAFASRSDAAGNAGVIPLLRVGTSSAFSSLDPAKTEGGQDVYFGVWDYLMKLGPNGQVEPNLARSVTRPGPAVYVYHLRHGVRFWDGNELTAMDVANSLNYQRFPSFTSSTYYTSVKSIRATDRYTVVVTLKHRDASWPVIPAEQGGIFEKSFADAHRGSFGDPGTGIMATGPLRVVSFDPNGSLELAANPHWWGGPVPVQHVSVQFFSDETNEALAFRAGQIDVAYPRDAQAFASTSGSPVVSIPTCSQFYVSMNVQAAPWNDIHVRRAVAYAINRRDLIAAAGGEHAPSTSFIPASQLRPLASNSAVNGVIDALPAYAYDLAKAKQELAKSAYPNGFSTTTIVTSYGPVVPVNEVLAAELKKIGINVTLQTTSIGQWVAALYGPKDKLGLESLFIGCPNPDPSWFPGFLLGSKNARSGAVNIANYTPPAVDKLISATLAAQNPEKRFALYAQLLRRVAVDLPYIPLFSFTTSVAVSSRYTLPGFNPWEGQYGLLHVKAK